MKRTVRSLTIIMGALLALAIVFAQLFHFQLSHHQSLKKETKTEQQQENKSAGDEVYYTALTSFSLPTAAHIELDVESFCLFEVRGEEESEEKYSLDVPHYTSKFLETLFRVIISPNAP